MRLNNLGPTALFSNDSLRMSSGKHSEDISHTHIVSLVYKLITSARDTVDLSVGLDRHRNRRQRELTNNTNQKGKYHIKIYLKDNSGFAEHQEKAIFGLGYKLTLSRAGDNSASNEDNTTKTGKMKIFSIEWYLPHYTPAIAKQAILSKHILIGAPTEPQYVERSVFKNEVITQIFEHSN